ncbi:response regulator [Frigoriglobus tundricola]|uniref:Response regulatory domain-containing protein n=1 Tax=Frigoriglobus tundricola TaxID=2774151 RepID=A0A6M5Z499_9BACT|nr:response regulator [Frigoriglobus tundricola]QJX00033.1 hypothetical protein FTUN_7655 [Frigoriglobus tundricola]
MNDGDITILVVDDSAVDRTVVRRVLEKHGGWCVAQAAGGAEALAVIARAAPAAVVTDLQMPGLNGLALVEQVRERFPRVPVILMTRQGSEQIAVAALRAGAASYVPKPRIVTELVAVVEQVLSVSQAADRRARVLSALSERVSQYTLTNDPALVSALVHVLREELIAFELCDATGATRTGIALEEALLNAVYHGNLEVSSNLKLGDDGAFERAVAVRRGEAPYRDRRVSVTAELTPFEATFVIADEGRGFDVAGLPDPTAPSNLERPLGRGVVLMRAFMDEVRYNSTGNRVTLVKHRDPCVSPAPLTGPVV